MTTEQTTDDLKRKLADAAARRVAAEADRASAQEDVDQLLRVLRDGPHCVGVAELAELAQVSRQAVYKAFDR